MSTSNLELLTFYRSEIKFQSDLLSSRLSSLLTSQSFLLIAYASAMSGLIGHWQNSFTLVFPPVLAVLGLGPRAPEQGRESSRCIMPPSCGEQVKLLGKR